MVKKICIIGTDTGIGKTYVTTKILADLASHGLMVAGLKPIASGKIATKYGDLNEDVQNLFQASNYKLKWEQISPFSFEHAIAPHLAAAAENITLTTNAVYQATLNTIQAINCNCLLIEGVGGLMVPLNEHETYLDLLKLWNFPVVLVVGMKLGCLNHTLLTVASLASAGISLAGWIANCCDPAMEFPAENLQFLTNKLAAPLLATLAYGQDLKQTAAFAKVFK